jgi:hypothetical protein
MATIGDIVLVYQEDKPDFFARIEDIWADRKPAWYCVKLLVLQVPVVETVWILREAYINGETFTMKGISTRLEKVKGSGEGRLQSAFEERDSGKKADQNDTKVISLFHRKKG